MSSFGLGMAEPTLRDLSDQVFALNVFCVIAFLILGFAIGTLEKVLLVELRELRKLKPEPSQSTRRGE